MYVLSWIWVFIAYLFIFSSIHLEITNALILIYLSFHPSVIIGSFALNWGYQSLRVIISLKTSHLQFVASLTIVLQGHLLLFGKKTLQAVRSMSLNHLAWMMFLLNLSTIPYMKQNSVQPQSALDWEEQRFPQ